MVTIQTRIADDLQGRLQAVAVERGLSIPQVIEETLRHVLMPAPFVSEEQAQDALDALQADVLSDAPWSE